MSRRNTVKFKLDLKNPHPLTAGQREELAALQKMPDEKIDYSDIPELGDSAKWTRSTVALWNKFDDEHGSFADRYSTL